MSRTFEQVYESASIPNRIAGLMFSVLVPNVCMAYLAGGPELVEQVLGAAAVSLAVDITRQSYAIDHHSEPEAQQEATA